jgi:GT2 family glycosyltransferase
MCQSQESPATQVPRTTGATFSVIVMTFNRPGPLQRCLESLAAQTLPSDTFEVVLVDASDVPVVDVAADFSGRLRLVHLPGPNLGVAGNRNRGAGASSADLLAFLDDDCVAHATWLERLSRACRDNPGALIGGGVENPHAENAYAAAGQVITAAVDSFFNPPGQEPRFFPGLNFAVERAAYLAIGGCDAGFGRLAAEDRDFIDRWRTSGRRLAACPQAIVRHEHRSSLKGFLKQYFNYGRGAWRYHRLRTRRRSGEMSEDTKLHLQLRHHVQAHLQPLPLWMRVKVILLLCAWQVANAAGFCWQAVAEACGRRPDGVVRP